MSDLKKLLEGLPIKVKGKNSTEIYGFIRNRSYFHDFANGGDDLAALGARVILRLMDECEEPKPAPTWEPKEAKPECEDVDEAEVANETSKELLGHGTRPDPFQGKHWDSLDEKIAEIEKRKTGLGIGPTYYPFLRQRDLRDEVRRLREAK